MDFLPRINEAIARARLLAEGGITLVEAGQIFTEFAQLAVDAARDLSNPGFEKKQFVLSAIGKLFDQLEPLLPYPWFAAPFRRFISPALRDIVLRIADGAIEAIYARMKASPSV